MEVDVTYVFDEIVARNMERLIGSRIGVGGLPLTVGTIACLNLLDDPSDQHPPGEEMEENSLEILQEQLAELGLRDKAKAETLIQDMISRGYILQDDQGRITGGKPAQSMARLMRSLFPKMQGSTLIAYFVQTIDEVLSGRKSLETAVAQFDQTLKMLGVSPKGAAAEKSARAPSKEASNEEIRKALATRLGAGGARKGARIIGSSMEGVSFKLETAPVAPASPPLAEEETGGSARSTEETPPVAEVAAPAPAPGVPKEEVLHEAQDKSARGQEPPDLPGPPQDASKEVEGPGDSEHPLEKSRPAEATVSPPPVVETVEEDKDSPPVDEDDLIEREVAQFQDELAAFCPLCKIGKVREHRTGTGRVYYKCSNMECNLVSWGKPHLFACPICRNPFLVEVSEGEDGVKLRCPRSTCSYRCTVPPGGAPPGFSPGSGEPPGAKPRKRLVRRRVVRRKK